MWADTNKLELNVSKCKIMSIYRSHCTIFRYELNATELTRVTLIKDLGVTYNDKLDFDVHITNLINPAYKCLGFVLRLCRNFSSIPTMKTLFFTLVRAKLEYGNILWNPRFVKYSDMIDTCQKRFLKYLTWRTTGEYPSQGAQYTHLCDRFNLLSLYARRRLCSILFLVKVIRGKINCPDILSRICFAVPQRRTRTVCYINVPITHNAYIYNSRLYFICNLLNDFLCCYNRNVDLFADSLISIANHAHEFVSLYN